MINSLMNSAVQLIIVLLLAPLLSGCIKKAKARLQGRRGPSVLQAHRDLLKCLRKETVISEHSSWILLITPFIVLAATLCVSLLVPLIQPQPPLGYAGDLLVMVYLFGLARFFLALAALDTGSAFGGMGASREMAISALAEPALALALFGAALATSSTSPGQMVLQALDSGWGSPAWWLAAAGFFLVMLAETGRIPIDNPDTHLELTMIHEGMLLEYSGLQLALLEWAAAIKQLLLFSLLANLFFPWGLGSGWAVALGSWIGKMAIIGLAVVLVESSMAKMRLFRVPSLLGLSFLLSVVGIAVALLGRG